MQRRLSSTAINNDDSARDAIADQTINCANELMLRQFHFVSENYRHRRLQKIGERLLEQN